MARRRSAARSCDVVDHARRERERAGPQAVDARAACSSKASVDELGVEAGAGIGEDEEAAGELAGAQREIVGAGGRARLGELDQRADDGGDEQPLALGDGRRDRRAARRAAGVAASSEPSCAAIATSTGCVVARARLGELGAAVAQRVGEHLAQARGGRRGRVGARHRRRARPPGRSFLYRTGMA